MGLPYLGHGLHVLPTLRFAHDDVTARGLQNADALLLTQCCQMHYEGYPHAHLASLSRISSR